MNALPPILLTVALFALAYRLILDIEDARIRKEILKQIAEEKSKRPK